MADKACSLYVRALSTEARERYFNKLSFKKGTESLPDPYVIPEEKWINDPCLWPELEFAQIYLYLIETPSPAFSHQALKAYKSLDAYRYVESGHVHVIKVYDVKRSPYCFLKAPVAASMRANDKPHQPWVCLHKESAEIFCAHCTCLAGLGEVCSHVAAILFKIELGVRYGLTHKSVTMEGCKWNRIFKKQVEASTVEDIQELVNSNRKLKIESVTPSSKDPLPDQDVLMSFFHVCPKASFFSLIPPLDKVTAPEKAAAASSKSLFPHTLTSFFSEENRQLSAEDLQQKSREMYDRYCCSPVQISSIFVQTQKQSVCPLWFEHRKGRVTATKAHDILVQRETTSPDNLVMRVMGYKSYNLSTKDAVRWGMDQESEARDAYIEYTREQHTNFSCEAAGLLINAKNNFMGATSDGVLSCSCCGQGVLEIKCPYKHRNIDVDKAAATDNNFCLDKHLKLKTSHRYYTQVQFQMMTYDCLYCDFIVMTKPDNKKSLVIQRLVRNSEFCSQVNSKCSAFIVKHLIPEILTNTLKDKPADENPDQVSELPKWCICEEPEYGKMIKCDNDFCKIAWFHYSCVQVRRKPRGKWFCPKCKK